MVNAGVVNGGPRIFSPPRFCESFRVFGQFPRFQNPFKYTRGFEINRKHPSRGVDRRIISRAISMRYINPAKLNASSRCIC